MVDFNKLKNSFSTFATNNKRQIVAGCIIVFVIMCIFSLINRTVNKKNLEKKNIEYEKDLKKLAEVQQANIKNDKQIANNVNGMVDQSNTTNKFNSASLISSETTGTSPPPSDQPYDLRNDLNATNNNSAITPKPLINDEFFSCGDNLMSNEYYDDKVGEDTIKAGSKGGLPKSTQTGVSTTRMIDSNMHNSEMSIPNASVLPDNDVLPKNTRRSSKKGSGSMKDVAYGGDLNVTCNYDTTGLMIHSSDNF